MFRLWLFYVILTFFMMIGVVFADVVSKDPNKLKRGFGNEVAIANYLKHEVKNANYSIIKDPTGSSPFELVENISPRKGDCGNYKSFGGKMGGKTDCNSDRLSLEIALNDKSIHEAVDQIETILQIEALSLIMLCSSIDKTIENLKFLKGIDEKILFVSLASSLSLINDFA